MLIKDLQEKIAELEDKVVSLESENSDLQSQLTEKGRHTCFSAELFKDDDKAIRHYTGICNWKVFSRLFDFLKERAKHLNYWRSARHAEERFAYDTEGEIRQGRPRTLKTHWHFPECTAVVNQFRGP